MPNIRDAVYKATNGRDPTMMDALNIFGGFMEVILDNAVKQNDRATQAYVVTMVTLAEKVRHHFEGDMDASVEGEAASVLRNMRTGPTAH